jgi:hypothetical protein
MATGLSRPGAAAAECKTCNSNYILCTSDVQSYCGGNEIAEVGGCYHHGGYKTNPCTLILTPEACRIAGVQSSFSSGRYGPFVGARLPNPDCGRLASQLSSAKASTLELFNAAHDCSVVVHERAHAIDPNLCNPAYKLSCKESHADVFDTVALNKFAEIACLTNPTGEGCIALCRTAREKVKVEAWDKCFCDDHMNNSSTCRKCWDQCAEQSVEKAIPGICKGVGTIDYLPALCDHIERGAHGCLYYIH